MKILNSKNQDDILFIHVGNVPIVKELPEKGALKDSWEYKTRFDVDNNDFNEKSILYPEFSKIVCVTLAKIKDSELMVKTLSSQNEKELLETVKTTLDNILATNKKTVLCGYSVKGFHIPLLIRRCVINQVPLPYIIDVAHLKPWEQTTIDLNDLWQAGGYFNSSLLNTAVALGLDAPDMDFTSYKSYWANNEDLTEIVDTCSNHIRIIAEIFAKMSYSEIETNINKNIPEKKVGLLEKIYNTKTLTDEDIKTLTERISELTDEEKIIANTIVKTITPTKKKTKVNPTTK